MTSQWYMNVNKARTRHAERRATPLVRGGASNHCSWRKNVVNSYNNNNTVSTHLTLLTIGHFHWMTMSNCQLSSKTNEWLAHNITRSFYSNNPNEWTEKSPAWTDVFWLDKYKLIWSTTWSERAVKMCQAPSVQTPHKHCENSVISENWQCYTWALSLKG